MVLQRFCVGLDILYGEVATGHRPTGRPMMRFKDICKRYMHEADTDMDSNSWALIATNHRCWRHTLFARELEGARRRGAASS